jgi:phosphatidylglycerol:prolipoprotein diacylglycerol transferase
LGLDFSLVVLVGGMGGARLFHLIDHWSFYSVHPVEAVTTGGASLDGAIVAGAAVGWIFLRRRQLNVLDVLDCLVGPLTLAFAIGSIGGFLTGDIPGRPAAIGPAVRYLTPDPTMGQATTGVYPAGIYEALFFLLIFVALHVMERRSGPRRMRAPLFFVIVGIEQLATALVQVQPADLFGLGQSQVIGMVLIAVGLLGLGYLFRPGQGSPAVRLTEPG